MFPWISALGGWFVKWISGFIPMSGEKIGKLLWVGLISFFVLMTVRWVDNRSKPPANDYGGSTIGTVINNPEPKKDTFFFGCAAKRFYLGTGIR